MNLSGIPQFVTGGLAIGAVYGLVGVGFSLIYSSSRVINFSQGEFVVIGGLLTYSLTSVVGWPLPLAIATSLLVVTAIGAALHRVVSLAGGGRDHLVYIVITLAVAFVLRGLSRLVWGTDYRTFSLYPSGGIQVAGATVSYGTIAVVVSAAAVSFALAAFLRRTMVGRAFRACASNEQAAVTVGITPMRMTLLAYCLSGLLGALAGVLLTPVVYMSYDFGVILALKGFTAAVVGGLDNPFGAVIGGLLLGILESLGVGLISSQLQDAYVFVALFAVLLIAPQGLRLRGRAHA